MSWPDDNAAWQESTDKGNWQTALTASLKDGGLKWEQVDDDLWALVGACPRCGHDDGVDEVVGDTIDIKGVAAALGESRSRPQSVTLSVSCVCSQTKLKHRGPDDERGCGHGRDVLVKLPAPT